MKPLPEAVQQAFPCAPDRLRGRMSQLLKVAKAYVAKGSGLGWSGVVPRPALFRFRDTIFRPLALRSCSLSGGQIHWPPPPAVGEQHD